MKDQEEFELITKQGYRLDEVVSALQKEIRRQNELMATYWAFEMNDSGFWRYCFRRLQVIAGEDCSLANEQTMIMTITPINIYSHPIKASDLRMKREQTRNF